VFWRYASLQLHAGRMLFISCGMNSVLARDTFALSWCFGAQSQRRCVEVVSEPPSLKPLSHVGFSMAAKIKSFFSLIVVMLRREDSSL
jgi:hypothetical protein